jgi:outer membrane protein assembly factor BamA
LAGKWLEGGLMRSAVAAGGACLVLALAAGGSTSVFAQSQDSPSPAQATPAGTSAGGQYDLFDLLRRVFRKTPSAAAALKVWDFEKPMVAIMPTVGSKPSTGITLGVMGNVAKYFGDPETTHISSAIVGLSVSAKKQTSINARYSASSRGDRLRIEGDNRFLWTSQDTYGLGIDTNAADKMNVRFNYVRIYETAYVELGRDMLAGIGLHYSTHTRTRPADGPGVAWDTSPYANYSREHGLPLDSQTSSGASLNLVLDSRDNAINASKGVFASASYRPFFKDVLGSDSSWQEMLLDLRTYVKVRKDGRQALALWVYGDLVTGGIAPYFDLPATGMDTYGRAGRGYSEGRFRGERLMYGELEYRATLTSNGLLGMVVFANATTLGNRQTGEHLFDAFAPAGGVGLRVLFNKRSKTNICMDYAWGRGSKGLYFALQEAF